mgnify:CR=1 FL=1
MTVLFFITVLIVLLLILTVMVHMRNRKLKSTLEEQMAERRILDKICADFTAVYYVELNTGSFEILHINDGTNVKKMNLKQCDNFNYAADQYAVQYLYEKETITGKQFMEIYRKVKGIPEPVDTSHMTISEKVAESVSFNEDGSYSSTVNQAPPAPWEHPQQTEAQQPSPEQTDKDVPAQNTEKEEERNTEQ